MTDRPYGLGRLYKPDPRDHGYLLSRPEAPSRRIASYWSAPGPVLDQGDTPMCVAYATDKWLTAAPVINKLLDPVTLYREAQANDEWPDNPPYDGTSVRGAMKALKIRGLVSSYQWAFDVETVVHHLLETGPMVFGTDWYASMFDPDSAGYLHVAGKLEGGHSYLGIGVNAERRNPDGTHGAVRILNSWGPHWGQNGRAWISLDDMAELLANDGEAAMGVEVRLK
jgi:hypothetical protein